MLKQLESIGAEEDLQEYQFKVFYFSERFLQLGIRIHNEQIPLSSKYLYFIGVYYFEGPMFWTSANFVKASDQIGYEVWKRVHPEMNDRLLVNATKIFPVCTVQTDSGLVKIAYGDLSISDDEPEIQY